MNGRTAPWRMALAGLGGCLLIAAAAASGGAFTVRLGVQGPDAYYGPDPYAPLIPIAATVVALCLLRWWPYLLAAGGLLCVPIGWPAMMPHGMPAIFYYVLGAAFPFLVVGTLSVAQSLLSTGSPALGTALAGLVIGAGYVGLAVPGAGQVETPLANGHAVFVTLGLATIGPAARWWRGDPAAVGLPDVKAWEWARLRPIVVGGTVVIVALPIAMISARQLADALQVGGYLLRTDTYTRSAILGGMTLVAAVVLTILAGRWPLAGSLTAATALIAVYTPVGVAISATGGATGPARWVAAVAGVAIGGMAAASRWRTVAAVTLTVSAAICVFMAFAATSGEPQKLVVQHRVVPAVLMLVLVTAAATAVVGATAPVLAPRGALPAALGPITAILVVAGVQTTTVFYLNRGEPTTVSYIPNFDLAGILLLLAAAAIGGLGAAKYLSERWAERKRAELIRQEAAAAERDRLARPIHDGVLQVLALVQREGSELGASGAQLAALAGEQEAALRNLLSGNVTVPRAADADLRASLHGLTSSAVEVSGPAEPVILRAVPVAEVTAAVQAALDNVRQHAGPGARVWILLEDEGGGVRVTVRDNGVGFEPDRLDEAARAGRLGVQQSMRGRITDLGGTTTIKSRPGRGTEVEFWIPR